MGKLAPLANDAPPSVIFENLAVSSGTNYAARRFSICESETMEVTAAVFLNTLTLFCNVSSVICDPAFFSGICFNNFLFVYAYRNCSYSLSEGRVDFSLLFYAITNFRCRPSSVVGIATAYGLDGPGIESRWGRDFPHLSRPALRLAQPPVQWVPGLSRG